MERTIAGEYYVLTRYVYRLTAINGKQALSNSAIATFAVVLFSTPNGDQ